MDIQPVIDEVTVIIGLLTPFITALVVAVSVKVREGSDAVRGAVSVLTAAAAGLLITLSSDTATELGSVADEATGILAVHIASWIMLTKTAVGRFVDTARGVLGR